MRGHWKVFTFGPSVLLCVLRTCNALHMLSTSLLEVSEKVRGYELASGVGLVSRGCRLVVMS